MYTKEQEEIALAEFALTGSMYRVMQRLGYHQNQHCTDGWNVSRRG